MLDLFATLLPGAVAGWIISLLGIGLLAGLLWSQLRLLALLKHQRHQGQDEEETKRRHLRQMESLAETIGQGAKEQGDVLLHLQRLPETVKTLEAEVQAITRGLHLWGEGIEAITRQSRALAETTQGAFEPILHTERLLGERIAALTRQHQTLQETLERMEGHEARLPQQMAELIRLSLRPAHLLLQRTQQSLLHLLEQHLASQHQERENWREALTGLTERFSSLDRLLQTHERFVREVGLLQTTLAEMISQIRIRPILPIRTEAQDSHAAEMMDQEIDRILQDIDDLRRPR